MAKRHYTHEWYLRTKESRKRATDKWLSKPENKCKIRAFQREYYRERRRGDLEYRSKYYAYQVQYRKSRRLDLVEHPSNRARADCKAVIHNLQRKANLIATYGGCCAMCGEDNFEALHLHHVNGDGHRERTELSWHQIVSKAIAHPNWTRYQLLCETCHHAWHSWLRISGRQS